MVAIDLITEHIRIKLQQHDLKRIYANLEVIPSNYQAGPHRHRTPLVDHPPPHPAA